MSRLLLDTHIFAPSLLYPERLSPHIYEAIIHANRCAYSVVTLAEILTLKRKGTLDMPFSVPQIVASARDYHDFDLLNIEAKDVEALENLPFFKHHKDPNDRMLIAQAKSRNLTIVTADQKFLEYDVDILLSKPV